MLEPRSDSGPEVRRLELRPPPQQRPLRTQPGQLAGTVRAPSDVRLDLRGPRIPGLAERDRFQLFLGWVRHRAPSSRYPARRARSCRRARWISFFTFCRLQPIAVAISPYPRP